MGCQLDNKTKVRALKKYLLVIWMLPLLIVSIAAVGPVGAQTTTIGVEPDSIVDPGLGPGSTFSVEIWVRQVSDLAGVEFKLGYDTTVLTATTITYGDIFGPTKFDLISKIVDAEGYLHYCIMEQFGEPAFEGDGRVAIITFSVDSMGGSTLDLYDIILGDSSVPPGFILHDALDGSFSNVAVHDIAVTSVTPDPTGVNVGDSVTINVTVTNQGDYSETFTVKVYADLTAYKYIYNPITGGLERIDPDVGNEIIVGTQTVTELAPGATTTKTFTWDTTGVAAGNHTISANATAVLGETETKDNLFIDDGVILSPLPVHDIAVTSVTPDPTEVDVGDSVTINVTVTNQGNYSETFDVTVYYDDTTIDTETDISLESGASTTLTFTWDTAEVDKGTYTISAEAILDLDEDTGDNTLEAEDQVKVREAAAPPNIVILAVVAVVAIIIIAAVIYIVKIRK